MDAINLQVKLEGQYAETFELFKERPVMAGSQKNTTAMKEILRTLPEWEQVSKECQESPT